VKSIPEGLHTITPHIVVRDAAQAAEWYKQAFGAQERSRVPLPGGQGSGVLSLCPADPTGMIPVHRRALATDHPNANGAVLAGESGAASAWPR